MGPAPKVQESTPKDPIFTLSIFVVLLVAITWVLVSILGATRNASIVNMDAKGQQIDGQLNSGDLLETLNTYNSLDTVVTHMTRLRDERFLFLPVWNTIKNSVPRDVQFTNVTMGDDQSFRLSGQTKSVTSVAHFANALKKQAGITNVTPHSIDKQSGGDIYIFSISFKVAKAKVTNEVAQ